MSDPSTNGSGLTSSSAIAEARTAAHAERESDAVTWTDLRRFEVERRSTGAVLLLAVYLGGFGVHRFYMGRPLGLAMLLTYVISIPLCLALVGFVGVAAIVVWVILDLFRIPGWVREYNCLAMERIRSGSREQGPR